MASVDREALTDTLLEQLVISPEKHDLLYKNFWANYFNKQSLRLTKHGFVVLSKELHLTYYTAQLRHKGSPINEGYMDGGLLIHIDRIMTCPFYLYTTGQMEIFGEKERAWLALHNDEIGPFLESWAK